MNTSGYNENMFRIESSNTGLRLLMKTDYSEYCGNDEIKGGSGFVMQTHGKNEISAFEMKPAIYLSPGYDYRINLKSIVYNRETEDLGLCTSYVSLSIAPKAKTYFQHLCFLQCIGETILKQCQCYVLILAMYKDYFEKKAKEYKLPNGITTCMEDNSLNS